MKKITTVLAALALVVASCSEKIDIELDQSEKRIVVEGTVTNELKHQSVKISESTEYFHEGEIPMLSGAQVFMSDGVTIYNYRESQPGFYESLDEFAGEEGKTYTISISYSEKTYQASCVMPKPSNVDSIFLEYTTIPIRPGMIQEPGKTYYNILFYGQEPGETENFYMMDAYRNDTLITESLNDKNYANDLMYNGSYIRGAKALQIVANKGDEITFVLTSIDGGYFRYLHALQESTMNGSPFAGPACNVTGNFSNGALGYFNCSATCRKSGKVR